MKWSLSFCLILLCAFQIKAQEGSSRFENKFAPQTFKDNKFWKRFTNGGINKEGYENFQPTFMKQKLDNETGLEVYIEGFENLLQNVDCPVLALFGEMDMNVDWQKTKRLYEKTLGMKNDLTVKSFPGCNHNLFECQTGGFFEFQDNDLPWVRSESFLQSTYDWLSKME